MKPTFFTKYEIAMKPTRNCLFVFLKSNGGSRVGVEE
jgi:hypothetical protein